jgi:hypothetical protein
MSRRRSVLSISTAAAKNLMAARVKSFVAQAPGANLSFSWRDANQPLDPGSSPSLKKSLGLFEFDPLQVFDFALRPYRSNDFI